MGGAWQRFAAPRLPHPGSCLCSGNPFIGSVAHAHSSQSEKSALRFLRFDGSSLQSTPTPMLVALSPVLEGGPSPPAPVPAIVVNMLAPAPDATVDSEMGSVSCAEGLATPRKAGGLPVRLSVLEAGNSPACTQLLQGQGYNTLPSRTRSASSSTCASVLSADSAPAARLAHSPSTSASSEAVLELQARWRRLDAMGQGARPFLLSMVESSPTPRTEGGHGPQLPGPVASPVVGETAATSPRAAAGPSTAPASAEGGASSEELSILPPDSIQLTSLVPVTPWAGLPPEGRARAGTDDSDLLQVSTPEVGADSTRSVVTMPRTGCVKVDVTAPVLDTGVLCFCTGQLEAKYSVGKGVGDGGYAVVKMAIHRELGTQHAVKFIRKRLLFTEEERASVKREVDIHVGLRHENVVRLSEAYEDEKHAMLVMEWVPGGSLQSLLKRRARKVVPVDQVRVVVKQVVAALKYLHSKQIVHGDLKPENILIGVQEFAAHTSMGQSRGAAASTGAGAKWASLGPMTKVKLCDFGNARRSRDARYLCWLSGNKHTR